MTCNKPSSVFWVTVVSVTTVFPVQEALGGRRSRCAPELGPQPPGPTDLLLALRGAGRSCLGKLLVYRHYHPAVVCRQCRFSKDLMNKQPASAGGVIYIVNAYMCIINMHLYVFK